jgi:hypothetical protein
MSSDRVIVTGMMTLFHGTTTQALGSILETGLDRPYLTPDESIAEHYAQDAAEGLGGRGVILAVNVDVDRLRYDSTAMKHPIGVSGESRDAALAKATREHPEWLRGNRLIVPATEWRVSFEGVSSVWYDDVAFGSVVRILD